MSSIEQEVVEQLPPPRGPAVARPLLRARDLLEARPLLTARGIQIALGVLWMLDGLFQFKSFMYTHAMVSQVFEPAMNGQPAVVRAPMQALDRLYGSDLTLFNTLAGELQVAIGLGLILSRRTVRPALLVSFLWVPFVWWFGEGFGALTASPPPSPLMGAPGAVLLYGLIGLLVWPRRDARPGSEGRAPACSGALGERGGLAIFSVLWLLGAGLWLAHVNRARDATASMIRAMAASSPPWLRGAQDSVASHAAGHGTTIAVLLAVLSAAVALGVWQRRLRAAALAISAAIALAYWVLGQDLGGPFWAEGATDFNSGPLFVLLALSLLPMGRRALGREGEGARPRRGTATAT